MKYNYHCHTARCGHAEGQDEAYVRAAIEGGFRVLGFSDHVPWPFASGYRSRIRMSMDELPDYLASVASLRDRYAGQITIHTGFECEWFPRYADHVHRLLDSGVEYLLLGQHFVDSEEETRAATAASREDDGALHYAESVVHALRTGLFAYLAHPDLYMKYRTDADFTPACERAADMICQAALETGTPLEFNLLGQLEGVGYPATAFWQYAAKWHNPVILGVDAHAPDHLLNTANIARGKERLSALGYTLLEKLPMDE